jgi:alkaline phosphatase D
LIDRVIIWTRVTPPNFAPVSVSWELATDKNFTTIFKSGSLSTDSSKDYTVKVDVTGLQAGSWYYYRFNALGKTSLDWKNKNCRCRK